MHRSQPDDRAVLVVEASLLLVALRLLQPFLAPEPLHLLVIDPPSLDPQKFGHLAIAVPAIALRQPDHGEPQLIVIPLDGPVLHETAGKADHLARPTLGRGEFLTRMNDGLTKLARRQALGFRWFRPSLRMSLSSSNSATIFFSRAFSFSKPRSSDN